MESEKSAQSSSDDDDDYAVAASHRRPAYPRDPYVTQQHYNPFSTTAPPPAALLIPDDGAWSAGRSTTSAANPQPAGRNLRKRTRASRRAPTTVLTTDTSNFRAMVQEFTGIPASPFSSSSSTTNFRARLDQLFGGSNSGQHRRHPYIQMIRPPTPRTADVTNYQVPMSDPGLFCNLPSSNFPVSVATGNQHHGLINWVEEGLGPTIKPPININRLLLHPTLTGSGSSGDRCEGMLESWICSADH